MSRVYITGMGAVSPAGWGMGPFRDALAKEQLLPSLELPRPGFERPLRVMRVPPPQPRPAFLTHSRLRRTSSITQFAVAAAVEATAGLEAEALKKLGVIVCVLSGCVNYSRRFYDETLKDPATASPLVFPETVFNAPASHISAYLGSSEINYTLVGDAGTFLQALAIGGRWLLEGKVNACLVAGTEEIDWLTSDAVRLFDRSKFLSEGAGAVLMERESKKPAVSIDLITDEFLYSRGGKTTAISSAREQLGELVPGALLCDSTTNGSGISAEESLAWKDWTGPRISPKKVLGEGLMASAAWQVVAAADVMMTAGVRTGVVSIAGFHQHAICGKLVREPS